MMRDDNIFMTRYRAEKMARSHLRDLQDSADHDVVKFDDLDAPELKFNIQVQSQPKNANSIE